jgi:hypothetical protein
VSDHFLRFHRSASERLWPSLMTMLPVSMQNTVDGHDTLLILELP